MTQRGLVFAGFTGRHIDEDYGVIVGDVSVLFLSGVEQRIGKTAGGHNLKLSRNIAITRQRRLTCCAISPRHLRLSKRLSTSLNITSVNITPLQQHPTTRSTPVTTPAPIYTIQNTVSDHSTT